MISNGGNWYPVEIVCFSLKHERSQISRFHEWLRADEVERAKRFRFQAQRDAFVAGRANLRKILADKAGCAPHILRFQLNSHGKPAIHSPEELRGLEFSFSRTKEMAGVALCKLGPLGFDMERIWDVDGSIDFNSLVSNYFSRPEILWYYSQPENIRPHCFYKLWTCKEAYLKALGIGLAANLDSFTINLDGSQPHVSFTRLERQDESAMSLNQISIDGSNIACLATTAQVVPVIRVFQSN